MSNEVIIEEYGATGVVSSDAYAKQVQIPQSLVTSQIFSIASTSAAFNAATSFIRVQSKGTGFWYAVGATGVTATANTAGSRWLPADQFRDIALGRADVKIATAA